MSIVLALLLLPLALAGGNAWATKRGLEQALESLSSGDIAGAGEKASDAHEDALDMRGATQGLYGFLWGIIPGVREAREDVRLLSEAAVDVTGGVVTVADAYPRERVGDGFLLDNSGRIDVVALEAELGQFDEVQTRVVSAADFVDQIEGSAPLVGPLLARTANSLGRRLDSAVTGLDLVEPLAPVLPQILGSEEKQTLLLALLNPAEQRLSGGAALTFLPIHLEDGQVRQGQPVSGGANNDFALMQWEPVANNPFHPAGQPLRLSTASLAPSWSVSGEEMLRAWDSRSTSNPVNGLVAVDVVALQDLMRFIAPIQVPGLGKLDETNLTEELVGSYEDFTGPEAFAARRSGIAILLAQFFENLIAPSNPLAKLQSISESAQQRHLAVYHRSSRVQAALRAAELEGDLSDTRNDYLGVFNQALKGLKSDYWQRRRIEHDVTLRRDGSARVVVTLTVDNDSPPPANDVDKKYSAYVRRDNDMGLVTFLPVGTRNLSATRDGGTVLPTLQSFRGRPFVNVRVKLKPQETRIVTLTYDVPRAAIVEANELDYRLDIDPHGLITPQRLSISVTGPPGFSPHTLPEGWTRQKSTAAFDTARFKSSEAWSINFSRTARQ